MAVLSWLLLGTVVILVLIQSSVVAMLVRQLVSFRHSAVGEENLPRAAVVLAIRGPDPYLQDSLRSLLQQRYQRFTVLVVVDSQSDPAVATVKAVAREVATDRLRLLVLPRPLDTCTLKCSSLIHALDELDPDCEVVAFVDGDVRPHDCWLRDLVVAVMDPTVGVATGNRWYMPERPSWGSLVRYYWNAGAVGQMWFNGMIWAGSMALRVETIRRISLREAWGRALSVDATVYEQVHKHGLRVQFVPGVIMVNTEEISLGRFSAWVRRQLVGAKNLGTGWLSVLTHAMSLLAIQLTGGVLFVDAVSRSDWMTAGVAAAALGLYWSAALGAAAAMDFAVRKVAAMNGQSYSWLRPTAVLKLFPAMVLTHFVYVNDLLAACFCNRVSWRGIEYRIFGRHNIRMTSYRAYTEQPTRSPTSSVT